MSHVVTFGIVAALAFWLIQPPIEVSIIGTLLVAAVVVVVALIAHGRLIPRD